MNFNDPIAVLNGHVQALSMMLTAVISNLEPIGAARVGASLAIAQAQTREDEAQDPVDHAEVREMLLGAFHELLGSIAAQR